MKHLKNLLFIFLFPLSLLAQEKETEYLEQTWFGYFNQTRLSEHSGIWLDLHLRLNDQYVKKVGVSIARIAYTYYLNDHARFSVGYAYAVQYGQTPSAPNVPEHRPWQQVQWFEKKNRLMLMQWIRLEERFRRKVVAGDLTSEYVFNYRIRYNMAFTIPLKGKEVVAKTPFIFINNEVHINFGSQITNNYFDQNRFFIGLGYQFTKQLNAHLGYMNVFQQLPEPATFRHIDAIRLFVFHNLDLRNNDK